MIKNGKYFVAPSCEDVDFKALFRRLATAGAGRPVDANGCPEGPWTPDLLANAISQIDANRVGVDPRTVQLWFQTNDRGISADNIRWLARIFGCDDPLATSEWQAKLSASQVRLADRRRERQKPKAVGGAPEGCPQDAASAATRSLVQAPPPFSAGTSPKATGLARRTEALFVQGSPLNLPAVVFAGAFVLQLGSYFLDVHSAVHVREDGVVKQVGFLWAPNWAFVLILLIPVFLSFVAGVTRFWRIHGRREVLVEAGRSWMPDEWGRTVEEASYTYWAIFSICIIFAGAVQWIDVRLLPLLTGESDYAIDWGALAIVRPETVPVVPSVVFTAFAYLYMSLCFYLFFAGLLLLHTVSHDLWSIRSASAFSQGTELPPGDNAVERRVLEGVLRCTMLGLMIAICMKLQTLYLSTSAPDILRWLIDDARAVLTNRASDGGWAGYSAPTHYTSFVVASLTVSVFLHGFVKAAQARSLRALSMRMATAVVAVVIAYLMIGALEGFSVLLGAGLLVAIYGIVDPGFGTRRALVTKDDRIAR